jgi:hypothetical protein
MSDIPVKVQRESTCGDLRPPLTTGAAATYHAASETGLYLIEKSMNPHTTTQSPSETISACVKKRGDHECSDGRVFSHPRHAG